jgi:uncharacterized protein
VVRDLRNIPTTFASHTVSEIDTLLDTIEREQQVCIPLAIESGSRAWGFPSPDSDYDCRFIYVRSQDAYLSLWPERDVIETPLIGDLDVNGWDLGKALKLMLKGNAVIIEWLQSPVIYQGEARFRDEFLSLTHRLANSTLIGRHYLHLGERQRQTYFGDGKEVALKKLFYALRPAATLRWMRMHEGETIAPMHFPTLMSECAPPHDVDALVKELLEKKAETRELGKGPLPVSIVEFVDHEFSAARAMFDQGRVALTQAAKLEAADFFRATVRRFG